MWKARSLEEHQIHAGGRGFKPVKPDKVDGKKKSSNQYGCDIEPYYLHIDIVYSFTNTLLTFFSSDSLSVDDGQFNLLHAGTYQLKCDPVNAEYIHFS